MINNEKLYSKNLYIYLGIGIIIMLLAYLFYRYHNTEIHEIKNLASSILQFSGIFSAILISYIVSKVFHLKQERLDRQKEIIGLAKKVTDFRRIANILYTNSSFLFKHKDYQKSMLYNDIKSLIDYGNPLALYSDNDEEVTYSLDILKKWNQFSVGNNFWYCLVDQWNVEQENYDFDNVSEYEQKRILFFCRKINDFKYHNREFNRNLLGDIGSDFALFLSPELFEKTITNSENKLPDTMIFLMLGLFLICIFGIIIPLLLISLSFSLSVSLILSSIAIIILLTYFLCFILSFNHILKKDILM